MPKLLTVKDVAEYLHVDVQTVRRYIGRAEGPRLRASRVGKQYLIPEDAVQEFVEATSRTSSKANE